MNVSSPHNNDDAVPRLTEALSTTEDIKVATSAQVITTEVPVLSGDIFREIATPAVAPPQHRFAFSSIPVSTSPARDRFSHVFAMAESERPAVPSPVSTSDIGGGPLASSYASDVLPANAEPAARRFSAGATLAEAVGIDLKSIGRSEARKIMSIEHKALGFRPPAGSLAAEAQAAAERNTAAAAQSKDFDAGAHESSSKTATKGRAKRMSINGDIDIQKLKEAAREDAVRILAERATNHTSPSNGTIKNPAEEVQRVQNLNGGASEGTSSTQSGNENAKQKNGGGRQRGNSNSHGRSARRSVSERRPSASTGSAGQPAARRRSNEMSGKANQTYRKERSVNRSGQGNGSGKRNGSRGADLALEKKLKQAAMRDAERIKATRGINGASTTEHTHVEVQDLGNPKGLQAALTNGKLGSRSTAPGREINLSTVAAEPEFEDMERMASSGPNGAEVNNLATQIQTTHIIGKESTAVTNDSEDVFVTSARPTPLSAAETDNTLVRKVEDIPEVHAYVAGAAVQEAKGGMPERRAAYEGVSVDAGDESGEDIGEGVNRSGEVGEGRTQDLRKKEWPGIPTMERTETEDSVQIIGDVIG